MRLGNAGLDDHGLLGAPFGGRAAPFEHHLVESSVVVVYGESDKLREFLDGVHFEESVSAGGDVDEADIGKAERFDEQEFYPRVEIPEAHSVESLRADLFRQRLRVKERIPLPRGKFDRNARIAE